MPRHDKHQSTGIVNSDNTDNIKEWDTSPHLQPMWARDVQEKLPELDARSRQFVRNGTINEKGRILVRSANHIDRIINNSIPEGTFACPTIVSKTDFEVILEGRSGRTATPKRPKATAPGAGAEAEGEEADGEDADGGSSDDDDVDRGNYKIFPERLDEYDGEIFTIIVSSITDKDTRKEYRAEVGGSGASLLWKIEQDRVEFMSDVDNYMALPSSSNSPTTSAKDSPSPPSLASTPSHLA